MKEHEVFVKLDSALKEVSQLNMASAVLNWDQCTHMPTGGSKDRGKQIATLEKIAHEKLTHPQIGEWLVKLEGFEKNNPHLSYEASLLRFARKKYEISTKVPSSFISKVHEHFSTCYEKWLQAKVTNNFKMMIPYLEKTLEYSQAYSQFFKYEHILDPLIAVYDYGFNTFKVKEIFAELRKELVPFIRIVLEQTQIDNSFLFKNYPKDLQSEFCNQIVKKLGYDFNRGRIDISAHPFCTTFSHGDVRITTRYQENYLPECLFSCIHETGHALYEQGIDERLSGGLLYGGASMSVHESQSRLYENIVGRSLEFWEYFYPNLQRVFPENLASISLKDFYAGINKVERSFIRTDADELTYNLHVMLRFDAEALLLEGKLSVRDLPDFWNSRMQEDLNLTVEEDSKGCLQDSHWYSGFIGGYFQSYTLGNIMSSQFYQAVKSDLPNLNDEIRTGRFVNLHNWLLKNLYVYGQKMTGLEVLQSATKNDINTDSYLKYLKTKFPIK